MGLVHGGQHGENVAWLELVDEARDLAVLNGKSFGVLGVYGTFVQKK